MYLYATKRGQGDNPADASEPQEAITLLLRATGGDISTSNSECYRLAHSIADRLERLPVAIDIASAYLRTNHQRNAVLTLQQYLKRLVVQSGSRKGTPGVRDSDMRECTSNSVACRLTDVRLGTKTKTQDKLAALGGISESSWDVEGRVAVRPDCCLEKLMRMEDDDERDCKAEMVLQYHLLQADNDARDLGVLDGAQYYCRTMPDPSVGQWWQTYAAWVAVTSKRFVSDDRKSCLSRQSPRHTPSIERATGSLGEFNSTESIGVWLAMGCLWEQMNWYKPAKRCYFRAMRISKASLGTYHPNTLSSIQHFCLLDARMGNYRRAEARQKQLVDFYTDYHGSNHPSTLAAVTILASIRIPTTGPHEEEALS